MRSMTRIRNQGMSAVLSTMVKPAVTSSAWRPLDIAIVAAAIPRKRDCTPKRRIAVNNAFWPTIRYAVTSMPAAQRTRMSAVMRASQEPDCQRQERQPERDGHELRHPEQPELRVRAFHDGDCDREDRHLRDPCSNAANQRHRRRVRGHAERQE